MKKKFLSLLLALAMCLSLNIPVFAAVIEDDPIIEPNGPQYTYMTENLITTGDHTAIVTYPEKLEGQPTIGTYVGPNGFLLYSVTGGGATTEYFPFTVSSSLPGNLGTVSVGVSFNLGVFEGAGTSYTGGGVGLGENQSPGYYHLYLYKEKVIKPFIVYKKLAGTDTWEFSHTGKLIVDDNYRITPCLVPAS